MRKAMILAAGRGKRMQDMGNTTPKALLKVAGQPLISYHLKRLAAIGVTDVVINLAHQGQLIKQTLGDGANYGVKIHYSEEPNGGYETAGGIIHALPLLGSEPFIAINTDIWTDFPLQQLPQQLEGLAHLVLVDNPPENTDGDFGLTHHDLVVDKATVENTLTYSGIALYHPKLFAHCQAGRSKLAPLLNTLIHRQKAFFDGGSGNTTIRDKQITGQYYQGQWLDIGTPERLAQANQ